MNKTISRKQRVRILATNELGTVTEKVLIKRQGEQRPQPYCNVALDKQPGIERWYWASELGDTKETAHATITSGTQEVNIQVTRNHEDGIYSVDMTGTPKNLKEHRGLHMIIACAMFVGLGAKPENLELIE